MLTDADLSLAEGVVRAWIRQHGDDAFPIAPDFVAEVIRELRERRKAIDEMAAEARRLDLD